MAPGPVFPPPLDLTERRARVWLSRAVEPGDAELFRLIQECGAVDTVRRIRTGVVSPSLRDRTGARRHIDRIDRDLYAAEGAGVRLLTPEDEEWPGLALHPLTVATAAGLSGLAPPVALWVRGGGNLDELLGRSVSIIGARASTAYGEHVATDFGFGLSQGGWTIVSGGAYGIDGSAHRGALTAEGPTVAFLAGGVDRLYPSGHRPLFGRIVQFGALVSEWPMGAAPQRHRFLVRNRLIAAVSSGTVVVEAAARSGTSATARQVVQLGRSLMAVPGAVTSALSVGTHELVRQLDARLVTRVEEVIEEVGRIGDDLAPPRVGTAHARDDLTAVARTVLDGFPARGAMSPDELALASGVPVAQVLQVLPALELGDFVRSGDDGWRLAGRCQ